MATATRVNARRLIADLLDWTTALLDLSLLLSIRTNGTLVIASCRVAFRTAFDWAASSGSVLVGHCGFSAPVCKKLVNTLLARATACAKAYEGEAVRVAFDLHRILCDSRGHVCRRSVTERKGTCRRLIVRNEVPTLQTLLAQSPDMRTRKERCSGRNDAATRSAVQLCSSRLLGQ